MDQTVAQSEMKFLAVWGAFYMGGPVERACCDYAVALSEQEALATVLASKFWIRCNLSRLRFDRLRYNIAIFYNNSV